MYSFDSRVRYSEVGEDKRLTLSGVINYFQDCSTFQSEDLNLGMAMLEGIHRIWVTSSWQIVIDRYPMLGEKIRISTWPYYFQRFCGYRNFTMTDADGKMCAYANSLWSFLDTDTYKPVMPSQEIVDAYGTEEKLDMDYAPRKLPMPPGGETREPFAVQQHHLDTNHHVNNGQYIQMAREYIPEEFPVHQMRAEYKKSALLGNIIYPVVSEADGRYTVGLCDEHGKPYTVVELS